MNASDLFTRIASQPPLACLPPQLRGFLRDYLSHESARRFDGRWVINTQFPPYPSPAFENLCEHFVGGEEGSHRLYSVTWAVTNRCGFSCWHCYNAGRRQQDVSLADSQRIARRLQDLGACMVTLTGGEPLLRQDLEEIAAAFGERVCVVVGTTGWGLTAARAEALRQAGVFAIGVSLDSAVATEHDRLRGRPGAFCAALEALGHAAAAGLYPYVVAVATREFLERRRFFDFLEFVRGCGALEVHLLEPVAAGRLSGCPEVLLTDAERRLCIQYQREVARREDLPTLSTFTYLESPEAFGCGAGRTHVYIDGSGELCPCNLVPLSFGNVAREDLAQVLDRMTTSFPRPRCTCVGRALAGRVPEGPLPTAPEASVRICREHLSSIEPLPRFFRARLRVPA